MQSIPRRPGPAPVINIATRQPMDSNKPARGGRRDPLPKLTITIPNYAKYQKPTKGRREWVRVQAAIGRNKELREACTSVRSANPLALFVTLLGLANNDGIVSGYDADDLGTEVFGFQYRVIQHSLDALEKARVIIVEPSAEQALSKSRASAEQALSKSPQLDTSNNDALLTPPTIDNRQSTIDKIKTKAKKPAVERRRFTGSVFFEAWWASLPAAVRRGSKADALDAWELNNLDAEADAVNAGTVAYVGGAFVASGKSYGLAKYLNDRMFESHWEPAKGAQSAMPDFMARYLQ